MGKDLVLLPPLAPWDTRQLWSDSCLLFFNFLNQSTIDLQCCANFYCTTKWLFFFFFFFFLFPMLGFCLFLCLFPFYFKPGHFFFCFIKKIFFPLKKLLFFFFFFFFLGPHLWYMEVPRLGVESELQLPATATVTAMQDQSHLCNLHHSSR